MSIKLRAKKMIIGSPFEALVRKILGKPPVIPFDNSGQYWDDRYQKEGNSGAGSYGRLAEFKAEILNNFVTDNGVGAVVEFGCGDGNQITLANYKEYLGFDISKTAIDTCNTLFQGDESKSFLLNQQYVGQTADLVLSLDGIYHLIEDEVYETYMEMLFQSSKRFVIIYASNSPELNGLDPTAVHVKHRKFTDWVEDNLKGSWKLKETVVNKYPFNLNDPDNTSFADFYFFEKE